MSDLGSLGSRTMHEFKNHLTIILGFAELMLGDEQLPARCREDLEEIRLAAQRALALIPAMSAPPETGPKGGA